MNTHVPITQSKMTGEVGQLFIQLIAIFFSFSMNFLKISPFYHRVLGLFHHNVIRSSLCMRGNFVLYFSRPFMLYIAIFLSLSFVFSLLKFVIV